MIKTSIKSNMYHGFALPGQSLVDLSQVKSVLTLSRLQVHLLQKVFDDLDHLGQRLLVRIIVRGIFKNCLEKQRVSAQSSCWLCQVSIEFQFPRFRFALSFLFMQ